jgi:tRNA(Ile2)-agmatinylcytidine synthase
MNLIIGIDDTDSRNGGCTTYIAVLLIHKIKKFAKIDSFPLLIRLNPSIKYKTRGNGAVAIPVKTDYPGRVKRITEELIDEKAELSDPETDPGVVFLESKNDELIDFSRRAIKDVVTLAEAKKLLSKYSIPHYHPKNGRGLIGALASASFSGNNFTYELLTYRDEKLVGKPRIIDESSVWEADYATYPSTWNTVDVENRRIVFAPHSNCPVLYGIRGDELEAIKRAHSIIRSESPQHTLIFKTNQGTDMHLIPAKISDVKEGCSYILHGKVVSRPKTIKGGHVFFRISDDSKMECAAFEPTKKFREIIWKLLPGDEVSVYGTFKNGTLNLEKIRIKSLSTIWRNPVCRCGRRMESAGKGKGFRCRRCKTFSKEMVPADRNLPPGLYEVPVSARRHISLPLVRMGGKDVYPRR